MATFLDICHKECHWHYLTRRGSWHTFVLCGWTSRLRQARAGEGLQEQENDATSAAWCVYSQASAHFRSPEPPVCLPILWRWHGACWLVDWCDEHGLPRGQHTGRHR